MRELVGGLDAALDRSTPRTWFVAFIALTALAYLPLDLAFGSSLWLTAGPFGIQASRIGLYFFSFAAGAVVGADRLARAVDRSWLGWPLLAAPATVPFFALYGQELPSPLESVADGVALVLFSSAMALGLLALVLRFGRPSPVGDSLGANAYGIYLMHWPIVPWLQFALLKTSLGPIVKGTLVLTMGLALSWLAAGLLRRVPGLAKVV